MKTFAIGIPTLNRYDLLKEAVEKYITYFPNIKIFILDNGDQNIDFEYSNVYVYSSEKNLGVAGSWNELCGLIFKEHGYVLMLNDDIEFSKPEQEIHYLLENFPSDFYVGPYYWSAFILSKETFTKVGKFDEAFYPAYFDDNDYHYRMKLNNCSYSSTEVLLPTLCRNSMTLEKSPNINSTFEDLKKYYVAKWGGMPGEEKFITSFNKNIAIEFLKW